MSTADPARGGPQLPVDRRETPEALAAFARPRSSFPLGAVALGTLVAWLVLPAWFVVLGVVANGPPYPAIDRAFFDGWALTSFFVLFVGAVPAVVLGLPLGALLVHLLRAVDKVPVILAAFLALGGLVGLVSLLVMDATGLEGASELWFAVPATALSSASGWLCVRRRLMPRESV